MSDPQPQLLTIPTIPVASGACHVTSSVFFAAARLADGRIGHVPVVIGPCGALLMLQSHGCPQPGPTGALLSQQSQLLPAVAPPPGGFVKHEASCPPCLSGVHDPAPSCRPNPADLNIWQKEPRFVASHAMSTNGNQQCDYHAVPSETFQQPNPVLVTPRSRTLSLEAQRQRCVVGGSLRGQGKLPVLSPTSPPDKFQTSLGVLASQAESKLYASSYEQPSNEEGQMSAVGSKDDGFRSGGFAELLDAAAEDTVQGVLLPKTLDLLGRRQHPAFPAQKKRGRPRKHPLLTHSVHLYRANKGRSPADSSAYGKQYLPDSSHYLKHSQKALTNAYPNTIQPLHSSNSPLVHLSRIEAGLPLRPQQQLKFQGKHVQVPRGKGRGQAAREPHGVSEAMHALYRGQVAAAAAAQLASNNSDPDIERRKIGRSAKVKASGYSPDTDLNSVPPLLERTIESGEQRRAVSTTDIIDGVVAILNGHVSE